MSNIKESQLIELLLLKLELEGEVSLTEFKRAVKEAFVLSDYDLSKSHSRPNELMYEQRCRNLISHKSFPDDKIGYENNVFYLK